MSSRDTDLDRLLRSAAAGREAQGEAEMPFGFDTRVLALSRQNGSRSNGAADLTRFVRRVAATAIAICAVATAGAYQQFNAASDDDDVEQTPLAEAYAIADSAIQAELTQ